MSRILALLLLFFSFTTVAYGEANTDCSTSPNLSLSHFINLADTSCNSNSDCGSWQHCDVKTHTCKIVTDY